MSTKKDMRRADLVIPYVQPKEEKSQDLGSTLGSTLPMAAMFTRNKAIGWVAVVIAMLNWISETPAAKAVASTPGWMSMTMSFLALGVTYMPLFLPPPQGPRTPTGTGAAPPLAEPR